jgi:hypothetical protein
MHSPWHVTKRAAVQINHFGRGKTVYFAGSIFGQSAWRSECSDGVRWVGKLIESTVRFLAPNPPYVLEAPESVWAGLNVQPAHSRHVLHLVDWQADLPARKVKVTMASHSGVGRSATQVWPQRRPLRSESQGSRFVTAIPEVSPHVIVLFE